MRRVLGGVLLLHAAAAHADLPAVGARATARAGVGVLSTDDGAALFYNPAGLARRASLRLQLGLALVDHTADFASSDAFSAAPAEVHDRAPANLLPFGGIEVGVADDIVVGAAFFAPGDADYAYPAPPAIYNALADDRNLYPQRYAANRIELRRRGLGAGVAARPLPWLAVGAAALAFQESAAEERMLWAGEPSGATGVAQLNPAYDMAFSAKASDDFIPGAAAGVVLAPVDVPLELGASIIWSAGAHLSGTPALTDSRGIPADDPAGRLVNARVDPGATTRLDLPAPLIVRAGGRWLWSSAVLEVDGEIDLVGESAPVWSVTGVTATPRGGAATAVAAVPLGPSLRNRFAVRAAADVQLIPGVLTLLGGYGFATGGGSAGPALPDLDAHTLAIGVEGRAAGATFTLGVAHSLGRETTTGDSPTAVDPFATLGIPAAGGRTRAGDTVVALDVEIELL